MRNTHGGGLPPGNDHFSRGQPRHVSSIVLPNLVLEKNVFPEFIDKDCTHEKLAAALLPLLKGGRERDRQKSALKGLEKKMHPSRGQPSDQAAKIVLDHAKRV